MKPSVIFEMLQRRKPLRALDIWQFYLQPSVSCKGLIDGFTETVEETGSKSKPEDTTDEQEKTT